MFGIPSKEKRVYNAYNAATRAYKRAAARQHRYWETYSTIYSTSTLTPKAKAGWERASVRLYRLSNVVDERAKAAGVPREQVCKEKIDTHVNLSRRFLEKHPQITQRAGTSRR